MILLWSGSKESKWYGWTELDREVSQHLRGRREVSEGDETERGSEWQRSKAVITACYLCAIAVKLLALFAKQRIFIIIPVISHPVCVRVCIFPQVRIAWSINNTGINNLASVIASKKRGIATSAADFKWKKQVSGVISSAFRQKTIEDRSFKKKSLYYLFVWPAESGRSIRERKREKGKKHVRIIHLSD